MIQVNTGNEVQKSGINPNEVDDFIKLCKKLWIKCLWIDVYTTCK